MENERNRKLLSSEREALIVQNIGDGHKTVGELAQRLAVSEATIRRDLENLERKGALQRVHGGAELSRTAREEHVFDEKAALNRTAKQEIARRASKLVCDGDCIFLDGGSTVLELAKQLRKRKNLTVVTNSLMAAAELMETDCRLLIAGGEFRRLSRTIVGPLTANTLSAFHIEKAFLGTMGLTSSRGLTTTDVNEAFTKDLIMKSAGKVCVLADSSKFGSDSFVTCGSLSDVDVIVTDSGIAADEVKAFQKQHIEVLYQN